jgi:hypothetical protein
MCSELGKFEPEEEAVLMVIILYRSYLYYIFFHSW